MNAPQPYQIVFLVKTCQCYLPLKQQLEEKHYVCTVYQNINLLFFGFDKQVPQAIIVGAEFMDDMPSIIDKTTELRQTHKQAIPIINVSDSTDLALHITALRIGSDAYFSDPVDYPLVLSKINEFVLPQVASSYRILIVDDDPMLLKTHQMILRKAGLEVYGLADPLKVMDVLQQFHPHLILMDLYMPEASGKELVTIIRSHQEYLNIPIVFLSGEDNEMTQFEVLEAGGDDFLAKPIKPKFLVAALINRVQRAKAMQQHITALSEQDASTGLLNRQHFIKQLSEVMAQADDKVQMRGVLYITLDVLHAEHKLSIAGIDQVMEQLGQLIQSHLTSEDTIARFEDTVITVLLCKETGSALIHLAELLCQQIQQQLFVAATSFMSTTSIGVSVFREAFENAQQWVGCAEKACTVARNMGGSRVHIYLYDESQNELSEADNAIICLLQKALKQHSFQLLYQAIVALAGKRKEFFELFLQLPDERSNYIEFKQFATVAENSGLALDIERWVVKQVLTILDSSYRQGKITEIFVHQSMTTIKDNTHIDWLRQQFLQHSLGMRGLIFAVSCTDAKLDIHATGQHITALRRIGVRCCLTEFAGDDEDFLLLTHLSVNYIKIVAHFASNLSALKIIAQRLHEEKVQVIVPGVDNAHIVADLWDTSVDYMQGLFIHAPADDLDFEFT